MVIFPVDNLLKLFLDNGIESRYVGGCVRDFILKKDNICDYDIAINSSIDKVINILNKHDIKISLINFNYNTLTVFYKGYKCEITSLRKDLITDGRHAKIQITDSWFEDSLRRDFTINSLYMDLDGKIYDFHKSLKDLEDGKIIFIGDLKERIEEDFLRILRFFRFYARFSKTDLNLTYLKILKKNSHQLSKISKERIREEFIKILKSPNLSKTLDLMNKTDVLKNIFGKKIATKKLEKLKNLTYFQNNYLLIIAILFLKKIPIGDIEILLVLTKKEKKYLHKFLSYSTDPLFQLIYYLEGDEFTKDFLTWYSIIFRRNSKKFYDSVSNQKFWQNKNPILPIKSDDIKNMFKEKSDIGILIKKITKWWCSKNFYPNKIECFNYLSKFNKSFY